MDTYRISIVKFSDSAETIITRTISTAADITAVQSALTASTYLGGNTCISCGTNLLTANFVGLGGLGNTSIMNVSTDGIATRGEENGTTLRTTLTTAGWDGISAEAIGTFDLTFLNALIYPNPGVDTTDPNSLPNALVQGFVLEVQDANAYAGAIGAKVQNIINPTPVPAALPLFVSGLGGGVLLAWRKKRNAKALT